MLTEEGFNQQLYIRQHHHCMTYSEIADHLGITATDVYRTAHRIRARDIITHRDLRDCSRMERRYTKKTEV